VKVHILLADKGSNTRQGTLNLLNAGWSVTHVRPGHPTPDQAVAVFVEADWHECDKPHELVLELQTTEGGPVMVPAVNGQRALRIQQALTVPAIAGAPDGTPGRVSMLIELQGGGLPLVPGQSYRWVAHIDGKTDEQWQASFFVTGGPAPPPVDGRGGHGDHSMP
jgi:hypothetical protein